MQEVCYNFLAMKNFIAILFLSVLAMAQSPTHSVTLTWQDTVNPPGTLYTVRAKELQPTLGTWRAVCHNTTSFVCVDLDVQAGYVYKYYVVAALPDNPKVQSKSSNQVTATVPQP